jgi:CheY-like chemotaxis protein
MTKVLVIDDEAPMREMVRTILEAARIEVIEAMDGVSGLALFREHRPPLVITDILMPNKDGIEAMREIRAVDPNVRIIAMSGGGRAKYTDFLNVAKEFGAVETLTKPFRRDELLTAVKRATGS